MAKTQTLSMFQQKVKRWNSLYPIAVFSGLTEAAEVVKKRMKWYLSGPILRSRTGRLKDSIETKVTKKPLSAKVFPEAKQQYKAIPHARGATIIAKDAPYLVFQYNGRWIKTKSVTLPQRDFAAPALESRRKQVRAIIRKHLFLGVFRSVR